MTERAVEADILDVRCMRKRHRLVGAFVQAKSIQRQPEPCGNDERSDPDGDDESNDTTEAKRAEQDEPTPRRLSWWLKVPWQQVRLPY